MYLNKIRKEFYFLRKKLKILLFLLINYFKIIKILRENKITDVKIYSLNNWHHGYCYFTGNLIEKKVFIKVDTELNLLKNDYCVFEKIGKILNENIVKIFLYNKVNNIEFLVYEYIDYQTLTPNLFIKNLAEIVKIVDVLTEFNIIHRDLRLENFLIYNNKILLIDFTFCISNVDKDFIEINYKNKKILELLGNKTRYKSNVWDDYYSLSVLINKYSEKNELIEIKNYIKKMVGKNRYILGNKENVI